MTGANDDDAWRPPQAPARPAEELEGYADLVEIGRGGDSVVYRARDLAVDREVAIKVLAVDDPGRVDRFVREIEITVALGRQHPNIVTVLAVGTTASGRPAIVMDFYERGSLHDQLRERGPMAVDEAVAAMVVVADALAFAHAHGVLHRDVKPQNVLVLPTSWVLADFGIARLVDTEHTASVETFTYRHASPQLLDGMAPTAADDLWALGSTLFTLLDGRPPFASDDPDDDSALAYLRRVRTEERRPLEHHRGQGDTTAVLGIVDRCLAKDLDQRWASAGEVRDALAEVRVHGWEPGAPVVPLSAGPGAATGTALAPTPTPVPATTRVDPEPEPTGGKHAARAEEPPPPAEPSPLALSVLAHGAQPVDEEPTGTALAPRTGGGAVPPRPPEEERPVDPGARRRRRTLLVLAAVALLVGGTLGLFGSALRGGDDDDRAEDPGPTAGPVQTGEPVPTLSSAPTVSGDPQPRIPDPQLTFDFLDITDDGLTLALRWNDPSDGEGRFVLTETSPEKNVLKQFSPGVTEAELSYPMSVGDRSCFVLSVVMPDGRFGVAQPQPRCVTPK
ncbi:serine/threonine protein kinase [Nocardioides anomalus]|uniref:non-specific serine/threonine protein kinase n=1 Tax=Nocardioides anomalus TaxID=2712223 RepID=A0A6G6WA02_9ACTN|nr:serine/threonine-protein kinase [Nocardioides anomalus]QIG42168.1 serine/threonine protein kinase [Nocardioides anomalus]